MKVTVNGQDRDLPAGATVSSVLKSMNLTPDRVAVELNRRLLKTEKYGAALKEGDMLEIVTFVGGG